MAFFADVRMDYVLLSFFSERLCFPEETHASFMYS